MSVRFSLFGVAREVLVIGCGRAEPVPGPSHGFLVGSAVQCCGRGGAVLTLTALTDAEYLISSVALSIDEYYAGVGESPGVWSGNWADALGVVGRSRGGAIAGAGGRTGRGDR